jgi:hypothetical protein
MTLTITNIAAMKVTGDLEITVHSAATYLRKRSMPRFLEGRS